MRLIVTGASGFVGRGLLGRLSADGHGGVATGREPPTDLPAGWRPARRDAVLADAEHTGVVDAVIHLEVKQHVPRPTAADVELFHRVNVAGTHAWLEWASRHGVRRFISTSSIKALPEGICEERVIAAADDGVASPEPATPYGRSKARGEAAVRDWAAADAGRIAVILRPAIVYGVGQQANVASLVRQIVAGRPCLVGGSDPVKSFVSRTNLAAAIAFALEWSTPGCEVFNVSDPELIRLGCFAEMVSELAGAAPPRRIPFLVAGGIAMVGDLITRAGGSFPITSRGLAAMTETSVFPCDKLVAAGFRHPQTTRDGIAEMVASLEG